MVTLPIMTSLGPMFENDWRETQLRNGGDLRGLVSATGLSACQTIFKKGVPDMKMTLMPMPRR